MKRISLTFLTLSTLVLGLNAQEFLNIYSGGKVSTYNMSDIDSLTFGSENRDEVLVREMISYESFIHDIENVLSDSSTVYNDFSLCANDSNVRAIALQTGQEMITTGAGADKTIITDGKICNDENYYLYVDGDSAIKYIGMTISYSKIHDYTQSNSDDIQPCVMMFAKKDGTWANLLHLLFYRDNVAINTREGDGFLWNTKTIKGVMTYDKMSLDSTYTVSAYIVDNVMYVRKPDNTVVIFQNDYFRDVFPIMIWQVYNQPQYNHRGYIHEIFAGSKPNVENVYRAKNRLSELMK